MPKLIVSLDGSFIKELPLTKDRSSLGRRPHNDFVFDNLSISGEHAVFVRLGTGFGTEYRVEDVNSTNGVYVNGERVQQKVLKNGDTLDLGQFRMRFLHDPEEGSFDKTQVFRAPPVVAKPKPMGRALMRELSGAGREVELVKTVTAFGKLGVSVASVVRRPEGFTVSMVEGTTLPRLNDRPLTEEPQTLCDGDILDLAGQRLQFVLV